MTQNNVLWPRMSLKCVCIDINELTGRHICKCKKAHLYICAPAHSVTQSPLGVCAHAHLCTCMCVSKCAHQFIKRNRQKQKEKRLTIDTGTRCWVYMQVLRAWNNACGLKDSFSEATLKLSVVVGTDYKICVLKKEHLPRVLLLCCLLFPSSGFCPTPLPVSTPSPPSFGSVGMEAQ